MSQSIVAAADEEVDRSVGEDGFGLHQLSGVALMKEVVDAVGIDSDLAGGLASLGHVQGDLDTVVTVVSFFLSSRLTVERRWGHHPLKGR